MFIVRSEKYRVGKPFFKLSIILLTRLRVGHPSRDTLGGEPSGQRVECCADLVKFANPLGVDPGDDQPAAAVFFDQLLLMGQHAELAGPRRTR